MPLFGSTFRAFWRCIIIDFASVIDSNMIYTLKFIIQFQPTCTKMYSSINHFIFNSLINQFYKINFFSRHGTKHACDVVYEYELYTNFIAYTVFCFVFHFAYS